jgi:hypothetical protein
MLFSMTKTSHPSRPGYMSSVDDRLEVTIAGGCEMYSATGLGFGKGSVCEKETVASKSRCLFCASV